MQSLIFFNKEGDNLNFTYNKTNDRWEGDLIFHENSDDTYKTIGLYTFEKIPSFEYENVGNLKAKKFQLFNEYRFQFNGNTNYNQPITKIELPNKESNFYSKWIFGDDFESKFPKGSQIRFNSPIFEFTNTLQTYVVVETKKGAILILSYLDNAIFYKQFALDLVKNSSYEKKTISGVNTLGFYNYVNANFTENFSNWSEPIFYENFYNNRKLNIIGTKYNDGIVTVINKDLIDKVYYKYTFSKLNLVRDYELAVKLTIKTDAPIVYTGGLSLFEKKLYFGSEIPIVLKPDVIISIPNSISNNIFITIDKIPTFTGNSNLKQYQIEDQVIWNNLIYECIQSYTWSATSSINPDNDLFWSKPKYLPVTSELIDEQFLEAEIHLTSNVLFYTQSYTQSSAITLNSFVEKYKEEFKIFDIDVYYEDNNLHFDLIYPSAYALIDIYTNQDFTKNYSSRQNIYEYNVEIKEPLITELNESINENFRYKIVFTDFDDYGLRFTINKQDFFQPTIWVYDTDGLNMEKTIDSTIRKWYDTWFLNLFTLGINLKIGFTGIVDSIFYNSIELLTAYPNVPINFEVEVGDTADFYIDHSEIIFKDISNYIDITINDVSYGIRSVKIGEQNYDITQTLSDWIDLYQDIILDYGIIVSNINNALTFRVKEQYQRLDYTINVGKTGLPAEELYVIRNKITGKFGSLVTSNELVLPGSYFKYTNYVRKFKLNPIPASSTITSADLVNPGDVAYTRLFDNALQDFFPKDTTKLAFREDDFSSLSMISWLDGILNTVVTIRNVLNMQYYAKFNLNSLIESSANFRHYNVAWIESNGSWTNISNGLVQISYQGEFDLVIKETVPPTWSFEDEEFATGQIVSLNNSIYPYNNQEYNIINLEPQSIVLDYKGPFWSTIDPSCEVSPFVSIGFDNGFGATGCIKFTQSDLGGEFSRSQYDSAFQLLFGTTNSYSGKEFAIPNNTNFKDVIYTTITENLYILGNRLTVFDAQLGLTTETVDLPGLTGPIKLDINPVNQFIYCLSDYGIHIVDPRLNNVISTLTFSIPNPKTFEFDQSNGFIYLAYQSSNIIDIWTPSNFSATPSTNISLSGNILEFKYHPTEKMMYVTTSDDKVQTISSATRTLKNSYSFTGLVSPLFYEPSETAIYFFDNSGLRKINNGLITTFGNYTKSSENYFIYNNNLEQIIISQTGKFTSIKTNGELVSNVLTTSVGQMAINQYDGDVYLASNKELKVLDTLQGKFKWSQTFGGPLLKIVYNPNRRSIFGIIPLPEGVIEQTNLVELTVTLGTSIVSDTVDSVIVEDNLYGTLDPNYISREDIWLKTREYIRKPKANFSNDIKAELVWKWENDQVPEMFLYDFSGDQLTTIGSYSYTGQKPLTSIRLNKNPNRDLTKISAPEYQQTIFDEIVKTMDYLDSDDNILTEPEPLEIFIGYNSKNEGVDKSTLKLYKREDIDFSVTSTSTNANTIFLTTDENGDLNLILNQNSDTTFYYDEGGNFRGLKPGQIIQIFITDVTNTRNKYVSNNNGISLKIKHVFNKTIIGTKIDRTFSDEYNLISDYPKNGNITHLSVRIKTIDSEIGSFDIYGQTVIEDIRFKIELGNSGQLISAEDTFIFKEYDINEEGLDWSFLNRKRKELLMVRHEIYSYIGSYKAIINAINYFGYNDLELYEYYRNINKTSKDFGKLFKVEIPDIFDNSVPGWAENDFIKSTLPNPSFEDTNLFNLTFKITDKEGNNILFYTLQEILVKLQGLKRWLQSNIIPLSHKILDITGRADFLGITGIQHKSYDTRIMKIKQNFSPYNLRLNEAYLMPVNSGSTVYTCIVDFELSEPQLSSEYFFIKIRTYQTHKEWQPFKIYNKGDKVQYFQQIYESAIDNNRLKNPRKYDSVEDWSASANYRLGDFASYYRDIYQYVGTQSSNSIYGLNAITPVTDITTNNAFARWVLMSEWKKSDYLPIQTLSEFRTSTQSYIFTVDSNLDPFIIIEVTSSNGYGQIYNTKKSYEIRGMKDLIDDPGRPDPMGPFNPILFLEPTDSTYATFEVPPNLPNLFGGDDVEILINSDQKVLKWELYDKVVSNNVLIDVELIPIDLNSVSLKVTADPKTKLGSYRISIAAVVKGGNKTISSEINGSVSEIVCPSIYLNTGDDFFSDYEIQTIPNGLSYTIGAVSNLSVNWQIIDLETHTSDITISINNNGTLTIITNPSTPTGIYSFKIRAISSVLGACVQDSGTLFGLVDNPSISGNYYSSRLNINCTNYVTDINTSGLNYLLTETNKKSPLRKSITFEISQVSSNQYDLYIVTSVTEFINNVVISNYVNTNPSALTATYADLIDNNQGFGGVYERRYKLSWNISGQAIQPAPSDFDIRVNFI